MQQKHSTCLRIYSKVSNLTTSGCYKYMKASSFYLCICVFVVFCWFSPFSFFLLNFKWNGKRASDREREKARVKVLTAIKAIRWCWHKYLTLRGNLQHVMSRPWLGWTVTPSHITWFHVGGWRGGLESVLHRLHIRGRTMLPLTLISIKPFLWNSVPHRSRLPTCLFSISRWCRILAERAVGETTRSGRLEVCACVCVHARMW